MTDCKTAIKYFWAEEANLPHNMGYPLFSLTHILTLIIVFALIIFGYLRFGRSDRNTQIKLLRIIAVFLPILEIFKIILLIMQNAFNPSYLPFYMCSCGMYVFPVVAFSSNKKVVEYASTISLLILMPGAFTAMLFPDWIGIYHPFSFMSIYSFVWHGLLVAFPIYAYAAGLCTITRFSIVKTIPFYLIALPLVITADHIFNCNYWFVERPSDNNPFSGIYEMYGYPIYILSLLLTCFTLMFVTQCIFLIIRKRGEKE